MKRLAHLIALFFVAGILMACGGGGGGGGSSSTPAATSTSSSATSPAATHTLQLSWTVPTSRENGTPLDTNELSGYQIYYYAEGGSADNGEVASVSGGNTVSAQIGVNGSGTYYFAVAAVDQSGLISKLSNYVAVSLK